MSELVLGRYGLIQTLASIIAGLGTLGLAFAIRKLMLDSSGSFIGTTLIAIYGAGAVLVAIFPTDQIDAPADVWAQSAIGIIHIVVSLISFVSIIVGMFVLSWTFARDHRWRNFARLSGIFAGSSFALFIVQGKGPLVGLLQRILVSVISAWRILTAFRVRTIAAGSEKENH